MNKSATSIAKKIGEIAEEFAQTLAHAAENAKTEADIRSAADRLLAKAEETLGIKLSANHEYTVASGRVDSLYDRVIIEYKNPNSSSDRIGIDLATGGSAKLLNQVRSRFEDLNVDLGQPIESLFGVGIDGRRIIFVKYRNGEWIDEPPTPVNKHSIERLLWALFNLGSSGRSFTAGSLAQDFGAQSAPARVVVQALYGALSDTTNPKAKMLHEEWLSLFGVVCGADNLKSTESLKPLVELYAVAESVEDVDVSKLLFCAHTYFALFMKFMAAEIISFYHKLPSVSQSAQKAGSSIKLKTELNKLEAGGIFQHIGIKNFLEGDLFAWYTSVWDEDIETAIRTLLRKLDEYNLGTLSDDPDRSQDLLKDLYLEIIPREVRHSLGEYYTPDWLAELVVDHTRYEGKPTERVLDPACGSGTFLVLAVSRARKYFAENREYMVGDESALLENILANIVGFDINPLAVLAARTNFLIAVRDLIVFGSEIEIPVFLADSVSTPTEYEDLFSSASTVAQVPCAALSPPYLLVPREIGSSMKVVRDFTATIEHSLKVELTAEEFVEECADASIPMHDKSLFAELYAVLDRLKREGRDGIWSRIIKNAFAPVFVAKFDYILGNPPWVNWEHLAEEYRSASASRWERYELTGTIPGKRRQSSDKSKTDVCILMTYVAVDKYLRKGGQLGFVLPRTLFQTELGAWHFRRFAIPNGDRMSVERVIDIDPLKPFRGQATNTSCVAILKKGKPTKFPVQWTQWVNDGATIKPDFELAEVKKNSKQKHLRAEPVDQHSAQSPWRIGTTKELALLRKINGSSPYAATVRQGINTRGANGVFFVDAKLKGSQILVTNRASDGRNDAISPETMGCEGEFLFPALHGRDVQRYVASPRHYIVMPHSIDDPANPVRFLDLPPQTREFLSAFRRVLSARKKFRNFDPSGEHWYGLYSVLDATFAPFKVVWREMATGSKVIAAAFSQAELPNGDMKIVVPDHKLFVIPCQNQKEADFVAGFLNADITSFIVSSYASGTAISSHILDRIPMPRFDSGNKTHLKIAALASDLRKDGGVQLNKQKQTEISTLVASLLN